MGVNQRGQIMMSTDEIAQFLIEQRVATLATIAPSGQPHLVAMWYAVIDGVLWFETKAKSQKAVNLRSDDRVTVMIETGHTYDTLRGVALEGHATIVDDPDALWAVGVSVWERYTGPYTEEARPMVELMLAKRVAVRVDVTRTRSWDHRKLGLPALPLGGSTAAHL
ncbi:PPOX class F420-dependent oxidoreductase [Lentzea roselyniae]|uniref:PPOX class F420-dependent oxidoreductase n=1 Tax=Lentzea roselyniae TaxID=531940 RepID=A0ABP7C8Q7_9PSEU